MRARGLARHFIAKAWNLPNTAAGLAYGGVGVILGFVAVVWRRQPKPSVRLRDNAVQFTHNPMGGVGAITLGNALICRGDPYDPADRFWYPNGEDPATYENGHSIAEHELQHTYQGELLGPLYLPSNIAGGLNALLRGQGWHGPHNWNERGPQANPPRPWLSNAFRRS